MRRPAVALGRRERPRRVRALGLALLLAGGACGATSAIAAPPAGPRLAVGKWSLKPVQAAVLTASPEGSQIERVISGTEKTRIRPVPFQGPAWSVDGTQLAFSAYVGKKDRKIYLIAPDGSGLHAAPGTGGGGDPILSPNGHTLAFSRTRFRAHIDPKHPLNFHLYGSTSTWTVDLAGGRPHRLTPWRNGLYSTPASFSPDGASLALTRSDDQRGRTDAVLLKLGDRNTKVLAHNAADPVFSPDGSRIALVSYRDRNVRGKGEDAVLASELYVMQADGGGLRRLTHSREQEELAPSWDPSGQRLLYERTNGPEEALPLGLRNVVMEINADGSCPRVVLAAKGAAFSGPVWQPGPGREAGPISCS